MISTDAIGRFSEDGAAVLSGFVERSLIEALRLEFETLAQTATASSHNGAVFGIRGAFSKSNRLRQLAHSDKFLGFAHELIGSTGRVVRGVLFDKTLTANWPLPWHQDRTAAIRSIDRSEGFENWTVKDGVTHAELPISYLRSMVTLRLHLDPCDDESGALRVLRGYHSIKHSDVRLRDAGRTEGETLAVEAGDLVIISPLTPHASRKVRHPCRRRVFHIEFCAKDLPKGMYWEEAA